MQHLSSDRYGDLHLVVLSWSLMGGGTSPRNVILLTGSTSQTPNEKLFLCKAHDLIIKNVLMHH